MGGGSIDDFEAFVVVERAKREAGELLHRYERQLAAQGRWVECVELGIIRYLLTAPIDFLKRVDALRTVCPEIDRVHARSHLRSRLEAWRQSLETVEREIDVPPETDA